MTREIRQMNIAGMDDEVLELTRRTVARALGEDGEGFDFLLRDIDDEIERREPAKETS